MKMGKRGWFLALLVLILAGGGAFTDDAATFAERVGQRRRKQFQEFLRDFSLQEWYDAKRAYPAPWHQNLLGLRYLSTREYIVIGGTLEDVYGEKNPRELYSYTFDVISIAPDSFGRRLASMLCLHGSDGAGMLESYWEYFDYKTQLGSVGLFKRYKPFKEVGEWALVNREFPAGAKKGLTRAVIFCRNGVIVQSWGEDCGDFQYLPFLQTIDAILQRDPARPAPAPEGFSEAEYQEIVAKVKAWKKEEERKARERHERELAQRRAEAERARASARQSEPPRGDASADCACPAPAPKAKAPRQGGHWLWRLLKGGCQ